MARKPFTGTVTAIILAHGAGALHIAASWVPRAGEARRRGDGQSTGSCWGPGRTTGAKEPEGRWSELGRWPANVIYDASAEVLEAFAAYGERKAGTAARFFFSAKASKSDRAGSTHPTVRPVALM